MDAEIIHKFKFSPHTFFHKHHLIHTRAESLPWQHTLPCASGFLTLITSAELDHKVCSPGKQRHTVIWKILKAVTLLGRGF
jgi:hypothetical protein